MTDPETSNEHRVAMAMHAVRSSVSALSEMSQKPELLYLIEQELSDIYGAQLALNLVASRAKA